MTPHMPIAETEPGPPVPKLGNVTTRPKDPDQLGWLVITPKYITPSQTRAGYKSTMGDSFYHIFAHIPAFRLDFQVEYL
jgi:hypothetical protein